MTAGEVILLILAVLIGLPLGYVFLAWLFTKIFFGKNSQ